MNKKLLLVISLICSVAPCYSMELEPEDFVMEPEVTLVYPVAFDSDEFETPCTSPDSIASDMEYQQALITFPEKFNGLAIPFAYIEQLYKLQNQ